MNTSKVVLDLKQQLESKGISCAIHDYQIGLVPGLQLEQQPKELETIIIAHMQGQLLKAAMPQASYTHSSDTSIGTKEGAAMSD